ncbi:MAG: ABC transporter permease, partial [Alphaproteobacteria bacterium]|nr:ABC transporter permease [Alphaproteobacteria bacterium]
VLGVVIGVASVITMVTLGNGATLMVTTQISSLGSNLMMMRPGQQLGPGRDSAGAPNFKIADVEAIAMQIDAFRMVVPVATSGAVTLVAGAQNWSTSVTGTTNAYFSAGNWRLAAGRMFLPDEERAGKAVCVIGATVHKQLFGVQSSIGNSIRVKSFSCEVVGVLKSKGQEAMGMDQDDILVMPLQTVQRRLTGNHEITTVMMSLKDGLVAGPVITRLRALMRERRRLAPNEENNFHVMDTRQLAEALSGTIRTMTALLGAVATVSLLVGGIGIMNIMLVSVTERTREIGIRLAIGAREREVLLQFLVEAVALSALGGVVGIALALVSCAGLTALAGMPFLFNPGINVLAFFVSASVGVVFGYLPARRAARLDPIEALRHE